MKFKKIMKLYVCATLVLSLLISVNAMAAESGPVNYPAGSPGALVGEFPPIPGLFFVSQTSFVSGRGLFDGDGNEVGDFEMDAWAETFRFLASYPTTILGANVYSQLVLPIAKVDQSFSMHGFSIGDDKDAGLSNVTVTPLLLNWHRGNSHYTVGLDIALKGFNYDEDNFTNVATGYNSVIPVVAYRYDKPNGLDIGGRASIVYNFENSDTDYKSGALLALDLFGGWNFGKWQVGITGGYTQQLSDDSGSGYDALEAMHQVSNGNRMKELKLGPSITYNSGPMIFEVNYQRGLIAENTIKSDSIWFNFTMPLYVPGMKH